MANFIVAVTGGIASGKSAVTDFFEALDVIVVDADIASRTVVESGQPALDEIVSNFGSHLLIDGQLNRPVLRELIFDNAEAKKKLEAITHPRIRQLLIEQCKTAFSPYVVVAIPLLAEGDSTYYRWINRVLLVDTTRAMQEKRLLARDHIGPSLAVKMLEAQATRTQRLAIANDVICNVHDLASLNASVKRLDIYYRNLVISSSAKTG
ncbi:MAG: dephospho-CoA kinase [Arenimonas sp.]